MMTSLYVGLKKRPLHFLGKSLLVFALLHLILYFTLDLRNQSIMEHVLNASVSTVLITMLFMAHVYYNENPMRSRKMAVEFPMPEGEEILKAAEGGYILDGKPVQGKVLLTNQRLIFRYLLDEPPVGVRQLEADRKEISEVKLSATHSIYRTGITVKVKDREYIFTVSMPHRWVTDIQNVVKHGYTAN
jgi:hypothetical protein